MIFALAITGPTASGKTGLSLELAKELNCEIVSCDSMQIYKYMDIGTAKPTANEKAQVKHHMIDFLLPSENYSAEDYRADAMRCAEDISKRGKLPLFVGGTGLYIDTVMRGASLLSPPSNQKITERLILEARTEEGKEALWQRLNKTDPVSAEKIHKNNVKRVVRALEIFELTGKTKSYFDELSKSENSDIKVKMITLDFHNRENLYKRIDERVDLMLAEGLLQEVSALYTSGILKKGTTAKAAIGYKEIISYLEGQISFDEAVDLIKLSSRRYAKRQLTWFHNHEFSHRVFLDFENGQMKDSDSLKNEVLEIGRQLIDNFLKAEEDNR